MVSPLFLQRVRGTEEGYHIMSKGNDGFLQDSDLDGRAVYRHAPAVQGALQAFWDCILFDETLEKNRPRSVPLEAEPDMTAIIHRSRYLKIYRAIAVELSGEQMDEVAAVQTAELAWAQDTTGDELEFSRRQWDDSIFELADVHTEGAAAPKYANFVWRLLRAVFGEEERSAGYWKRAPGYWRDAASGRPQEAQWLRESVEPSSQLVLQESSRLCNDGVLWSLPDHRRPTDTAALKRMVEAQAAQSAERLRGIPVMGQQGGTPARAALPVESPALLPHTSKKLPAAQQPRALPLAPLAARPPAAAERAPPEPVSSSAPASNSVEDAVWKEAEESAVPGSASSDASIPSPDRQSPLETPRALRPAAPSAAAPPPPVPTPSASPPHTRLKLPDSDPPRAVATLAAITSIATPGPILTATQSAAPAAAVEQRRAQRQQDELSVAPSQRRPASPASPLPRPPPDTATPEAEARTAQIVAQAQHRRLDLPPSLPPVTLPPTAKALPQSSKPAAPSAALMPPHQASSSHPPRHSPRLAAPSQQRVETLASVATPASRQPPPRTAPVSPTHPHPSPQGELARSRAMTERPAKPPSGPLALAVNMQQQSPGKPLRISSSAPLLVRKEREAVHFKIPQNCLRRAGVWDDLSRRGAGMGPRPLSLPFTSEYGASLDATPPHTRELCLPEVYTVDYWGGDAVLPSMVPHLIVDGAMAFLASPTHSNAITGGARLSGPPGAVGRAATPGPQVVRRPFGQAQRAQIVSSTGLVLQRPSTSPEMSGHRHHQFAQQDEPMPTSTPVRPLQMAPTPQRQSHSRPESRRFTTRPHWLKHLQRMSG